MLGQGEAEQGWFSPSELQFIPNYAIGLETSGSRRFTGNRIHIF